MHQRYDRSDPTLPYAAHLAALLAFALLGAPMHPVMMRGRLLAVLAHAHVAERRLARHLGALHHNRQAAGVHDDLAGRALHPGSVFLFRRRAVDEDKCELDCSEC